MSLLLSFTKVANDETGDPPVPFDITPFLLTLTMTTGPQKQDEVPSSFCKAERLDYASF